MLVGSRIHLGPLLPADSEPLFQWSNDVGIAHLNGPYRPVDWASHGAWFDGVGKDAGKVLFAIRDNATARLLGYVQVGGIHPVFRSADLGIVIGDAADRGRGLGQEALRLALDFCWKDLNLRRVGLFVFGRNEQAVAAYLKVGFQHEGVLHRAAFVDGRYVDVTVMGILRPAMAA